MKITEKLNLTTNLSEAPEGACIIKTRRDVNIFDTLLKYCADNNIDVRAIDDNDFSECADCITRFKQSCLSEYYQFAFWID